MVESTIEIVYLDQNEILLFLSSVILDQQFVPQLSQRR